MTAPRDLEILRHFETGKRPKQIAEKLNLSPRHVRLRLSDLACGSGRNIRHENAMAAGSQALQAAIENARAG